MYKILMILLNLILFSGCVSPSYQQQYREASQKNAEAVKQIREAKQLNQYFAPAVIQHPKFYANNVYRSGAVPAWFSRTVSIHASGLPLSLTLMKIMPANSIGIQYGAGTNKNQLITLNYSGTVVGALDKIAAQTGYAYNIEDNMLMFSPFVTKTFDISFMPGTSQYMVGQKQGDSMLSSSSAGAAAGSQSDSQYSSLEGSLSVWKDLKNSVQEMLSPEGKVMVSESTTTITVRDHPQNLQAVADYLASMNNSLSKEVLLKVRVLQINLDKSFDYGIDWNLAYKSASAFVRPDAELSQPLTIGSNLGGEINRAGMAGISAGISSGIFQNTQILINALSQQGSVSNITNPEVTTLNNQVAQIDISRQTTYLASSTTTLTAGASAQNTGFAQTSLNPGVISTGFKLYILPKIMNHNIYLEISSELSSLQKLGQVKSNGNMIQLPVIDGKHFNLRSMVPSDSTLIVAGFNSVDTVAGENTHFGVLGGRNADQKHVETILLITPIIMENNHS